MDDVALTAAHVVVFTLDVFTQRVLQVTLLVLVVQLLLLVAASACQLPVEVLVLLTVVLMTDVNLCELILVCICLLSRMMILIDCISLCLHKLGEAITAARLMENRACFIPATATLFLDKVNEETSFIVRVIAATAMIFVFRHGCY